MTMNMYHAAVYRLRQHRFTVSILLPIPGLLHAIPDTALRNHLTASMGILDLPQFQIAQLISISVAAYMR